MPNTTYSVSVSAAYGGMDVSSSKEEILTAKISRFTTTSSSFPNNNFTTARFQTTSRYFRRDNFTTPSRLATTSRYFPNDNGKTTLNDNNQVTGGCYICTFLIRKEYLCLNRSKLLHCSKKLFIKSLV